MTPCLPAKTLFSDAANIGQNVTVKGWLRSKRDSKAGISFLAIHVMQQRDPCTAILGERATEA